MANKNRRLQDKIAHRKLQLKSGKSEDRFFRDHPRQDPAVKQTPQTAEAIAKKMGIDY